MEFTTSANGKEEAVQKVIDSLETKGYLIDANGEEYYWQSFSEGEITQMFDNEEKSITATLEAEKTPTPCGGGWKVRLIWN